jgi:hypothetical protein
MEISGIEDTSKVRHYIIAKREMVNIAFAVRQPFLMQ